MITAHHENADHEVVSWEAAEDRVLESFQTPAGPDLHWVAEIRRYQFRNAGEFGELAAYNNGWGHLIKITDPGPATVQAPTQPTAPRLTASGNAVTVSVTAERASWYEYLYRPYQEGEWTKITNVTSASYTITGLDYGRRYEISARAVNARAASRWSDVATVTTESSCLNGITVPKPASNPSLVADCEALLAAKDTLRGSAALDWNASTAITAWPGVTVRPVPVTTGRSRSAQQVQRVTSLSLTYDDLNGSIPASLGDLTELQYLHLNDNDLSGPIPAELGSLRNLQLLYVNDNELTGTIPAELGNLSSLRFLAFENNSLSGAIPVALDRPPLTYLHLGGNGFSGCIPGVLSDVRYNDFATADMRVGDCPTVSIARSPSTPETVTEGTPVSFTLTRSGSTAESLTANVTLSTDPPDASVYTGSASRTVTFSANQATATLTVSTVSDTTDEANANVTATVATGPSYVPGTPASATVTVNDSDGAALPTVTIALTSPATTRVTEGASLSFTLTRSGSTTGTLTANVTLSTDPATASVYTGSASRTVTFSANHATATLTVSTDDDTTAEASADVTATVATGTGYVPGTPGSATVTVTDNDGTAVTIARSSSMAAMVTEGTELSFTLTRSGSTSAALTANVTLSTDPATASVYTGSATRTVTFSANQATTTLTVSTDDDGTDEVNADVTATVATGTGYVPGTPGSATVTVADNDGTAVTTATLTVRIAGRHRDNGDAEVGLQQQDANGQWGDRQLPRVRRLLASSTVDSWHYSSELTLTSASGNESVVVRIAARRQSDGDVEVALQYQNADGWSDRQLPTGRFLKADVPVDTWRYSSSLTVTASSASTSGSSRASGAAGQSGTDTELQMAAAPPGTPADTATSEDDLPMDATP